MDSNAGMAKHVSRRFQDPSASGSPKLQSEETDDDIPYAGCKSCRKNQVRYDGT